MPGNLKGARSRTRGSAPLPPRKGQRRSVPSTDADTRDRPSGVNARPVLPRAPVSTCGRSPPSHQQTRRRWREPLPASYPWCRRQSDSWKPCRFAGGRLVRSPRRLGDRTAGPSDSLSGGTLSGEPPARGVEAIQVFPCLRAPKESRAHLGLSPRCRSRPSRRSPRNGHRSALRATSEMSAAISAEHARRGRPICRETEATAFGHGQTRESHARRRTEGRAPSTR